MIILLDILLVLLFFILVFGSLIWIALNMNWDWTEEGELLIWYDSYTPSDMKKERKYIVLYRKK